MINSKINYNFLNDNKEMICEKLNEIIEKEIISKIREFFMYDCIGRKDYFPNMSPKDFEETIINNIKNDGVYMNDDYYFDNKKSYLLKSKDSEIVKYKDTIALWSPNFEPNKGYKKIGFDLDFLDKYFSCNRVKIWNNFIEILDRDFNDWTSLCLVPFLNKLYCDNLKLILTYNIIYNIDNIEYKYLIKELLVGDKKLIFKYKNCDNWKYNKKSIYNKKLVEVVYDVLKIYNLI